jgi:hypothetical protein
VFKRLNSKHLALTVILLVTSGPLASNAAPQTGTEQGGPKHTATGQSGPKVSGTVRSISKTELVISPAHPKKGDLSFQLDPETKFEGTIVDGADVLVRFKTVHDQNVATQVILLKPDKKD